MGKQIPEVPLQPTQTGIVSEVKPNKSPFRTVLFVFLGLTVITGAVYAGMQIGKKQTPTSIPASPDASQGGPTQVEQPTSTAVIPTISTPEETANWKTFFSKICGFSLKIPPQWAVEDTNGTDTVGYNFMCTSLEAPDFKITGMDTREGLMMRVDRTLAGSTFKTVKINSLSDYIEATETIQQPKIPAKNVQNKSYGKLSGKYFEYAAFENTANFIFLQENYIYSIQWNADYQGNYKSDIEQIIASLTF